MDEVILNYIELSEEQRKNALMNLKNIGFIRHMAQNRQ